MILARTSSVHIHDSRFVSLKTPSEHSFPSPPRTRRHSPGHGQVDWNGGISPSVNHSQHDPMPFLSLVPKLANRESNPTIP